MTAPEVEILRRAHALFSGRREVGVLGAPPNAAPPSGEGLPSRPSSIAVSPSTRASNRFAMPAACSTAAQLRLLETTAVRSPAWRSSRIHATDPGNACTPLRAISSSTRTCLRLPSPHSDCSSGGESGVPGGRLIPREARKSCTPTWRGLPSTAET